MLSQFSQLSNQSLQKTLFEGKKGIYNAHYALIISTEEADNANAHTTEYQVMKDEYGFAYFNRIDIKNDEVFKKWYTYNTKNFGEWISWRVTQYRSIILDILKIINC